MRSHHRLIALLLSLLLATTLATTASAAALDSASLIASLAQPLPAKTTYFEQRESPLLAQPLQFSGVLERPAVGTLVKSVAQPYVERTVIADGRVTIEREGQARRRFSLKRAPELVALTASFEAILSGDASTLQQHYRIDTLGNAEAWTLTLTPREPRLAKRVLAIRLYGGLLDRYPTLRCIDLDLAGAENSRMWIGELAARAMANTDAAERDAMCSGAELKGAMLRPNKHESSFPRRRESRALFSGLSSGEHWIPAVAGMTSAKGATRLAGSTLHPMR